MLSTLDYLIFCLDKFSFLNSFILECEALIINAITLFEKGYFDNACYSLRQALELANNMAYFSELTDENRDLEYRKWGLNEKLESRKVGNYLNNYAENYKEIKIVFKDHFDNIKRTKEELNIIVHKQGINTFYVFLRGNKNQSLITVEKFTSYLKTVIGAVAILRLTIDPIPALLMDEEIYLRLPNLMTEPYDIAFVTKYIGKEYIEDYKKTQLYKIPYNSLMENEKLNEATASLVKFQHINVDKLDEILLQVHLLDAIELIALSIAISSNKISRIYYYEGMRWYFTNIESLRKNRGYSSSVIQSFARDKNCFNQIYENVFMSYITNSKNKDFSFYIEHNSELINEEVRTIENQYEEILVKMDI